MGANYVFGIHFFKMLEIVSDKKNICVWMLIIMLLFCEYYLQCNSCVERFEYSNPYLSTIQSTCISYLHLRPIIIVKTAQCEKTEKNYLELINCAYVFDLSIKFSIKYFCGNWKVPSTVNVCRKDFRAGDGISKMD